MHRRKNIKSHSYKFHCYNIEPEDSSIFRIFVKQFNPLKPSGHYMYRHFNIKKFLVLPRSVFMCFVWISEQTAIISLYIIN